LFSYSAMTDTLANHEMQFTEMIRLASERNTEQN
jgi:hypothetical protein